jgi:ribonuclease HII
MKAKPKSQLLPYLHSRLVEAGLDEVGRGCLAGPVVAGAVILPHNFRASGLQDSKLLSPKKRLYFAEMIKAEASDYGIGQASPREIEQHNILQASFIAMHRALEQLQQPPEMLLIDGNRFKPWRDIPYSCQIKGDSRYLSIAAASVIAKVHRDNLMLGLADAYPEYSWNTNKGYPTKEHKSAIAKHGITMYHRKTFKLS